MTFHGQSLLSCVWGVTHAAAAPESGALPAEVRRRSSVRPPVRLSMLGRVFRKLRSDSQSGASGSANQR
jgi:hypothetical protein